MGAIGMNEIMSIPQGYEACDAMLKASEVELVSAGTVCAGKYYIVVAGEVAAVRSSVEAGRETEVEFFAGTICRLGRKHGVVTPCNDLVLRELGCHGGVISG